jgi:hypothetical protein
LSTKSAALLLLSVIFFDLTACGPNPATILNRSALDSRAIEVILEGYMASMMVGDTTLAHMLFSTSLQAERSEEMLLEEINGPGLIAYEGFHKVGLISVERIQGPSDFDEVRNVVAMVQYENGETGVIVAQMVAQADSWAINSIEVYVSPERKLQ